MKQWADLYQRFAFLPSSRLIVDKPTEEQFAWFEAEYNCKLPEDYRRWASTFGPGQFDFVLDHDGSFYIDIQTPGCIQNPGYDLGLVNQHPSCWIAESHHPLLIVAVAPSGGVGWDRLDCARSPLYKHGVGDDVAQLIAPSFSAFVDALLSGKEGLSHFLTEERTVLEVSFIPASPLQDEERERLYPGLT